MVNKCGLQLGPALLAAGLMNVVTGLAFGIPIAVQPMKIIAAVAIAEGFNEAQILTAGVVAGAAVLLLAVTGSIEWLVRVVPRSVVRGLQLALGLKLLTGGYSMIVGTGVWIGWDSIGLGILCVCLVLLLYFSKRMPPALVVFVIGIGALFVAQPELLTQASLGMSWHRPDLSNPQDWLHGMWRGALPQLPMTVLNSVIAVCALSVDLFPNRPASPRKMALSVAIMNLLCCPFGGMPMCHGAGGLAAQYRFGARTGGSMVILGAVKIVLALLFGGSLLLWMTEYPKSVLGVLLLFSGMELSLVCRDQKTRVDFFVMLLTAGACMAINTAVGFVVGQIAAMALAWGVFRIDPPSSNNETIS